MAQCPQQLAETFVPAQRGPACAAVWKLPGFATPGARPRRPWVLVCEDGDPYCDTDGLVDGICRIAVNACVETPIEGCDAEAVRTLRFTKSSRRALAGFVPPPAPSAGEACGTRGVVALRLAGQRGIKPASVTLELRARTASRVARNRLTVHCVLPGSDICPARAPGAPTMLHLVTGRDSDLDVGPAPGAKSVALAESAELRFCLAGCDSSARPRCAGIGGTGRGSLNGETFGAPQPLVSAGAALCMVHRYADDVCGTFQLDTGDASIEMSLLSDVYLTESIAQPCPVCEGGGVVGSTGRCSASARSPRAACIVQAVSSRGDALSSDCLPSRELIGTLQQDIPLTTGTSSLAPGPRPCPFQSVPVGCSPEDTCDARCTGNACVALDAEGRCVTANGGIAQACCSNDPASECFPADAPITRSGRPAVAQPAWPDPAYPKTAAGMVLAGVFCVPPPEGQLLITDTDRQTGPGAVILPVERLTVFGSS